MEIMLLIGKKVLVLTHVKPIHDGGELIWVKRYGH